MTFHNNQQARHCHGFADHKLLILTGMVLLLFLLVTPIVRWLEWGILGHLALTIVAGIISIIISKLFDKYAVYKERRESGQDRAHCGALF